MTICLPLPRGIASTSSPLRTPHSALRIGHSALRTRRAAFTFVEVLVVISVISILLGLLYAGVSAALRASKEQNTRTLVAEVGIAIANFYNMQDTYPKMETGEFCGATLVEELGSLLQVRSLTSVDTPDGKAVADAWGRPLMYTRYVAAAASTAPGASNGEGGIQPINNPKTFDLFSTGAYADKITGLTGAGTSVQTVALTVTNGKYAHDGEKIIAGSKPTGEINIYFGNW